MRRLVVIGLGGAVALGAAIGLTRSGREQGPPTTTVDAGAIAGHVLNEAPAREPDVPELPFPDNPDPLQCGIPVQWGVDEPAWLTGVWEEELIQPEVLLYDSHLRLSVAGRAPHGSVVEVVLFQENPTLDYYFVRTATGAPQEGWVPAPFLSFEPLG